MRGGPGGGGVEEGDGGADLGGDADAIVPWEEEGRAAIPSRSRVFSAARVRVFGGEEDVLEAAVVGVLVDYTS